MLAQCAASDEQHDSLPPPHAFGDEFGEGLAELVVAIVEPHDVLPAVDKGHHGRLDSKAFEPNGISLCRLFRIDGLAGLDLRRS